MAGGEISKTLPFFPAEHGWAQTSTFIFAAQPVLFCWVFDFGFKEIPSPPREGQDEGNA
jgi:hypothetical protein